MSLRARWNRFANRRAGTAAYFTLTSAHYGLARVLLPTVGQHASGKILDLGAGFGTYRPELERLGDQYVGIDAQFHGANLDALADGHQLPFTTGALDTVFCSQVLEHTPEPWQLLQEAHRVLRVGGVLVASAPHLSYVHAAPHDYYRYTNYGLTFLLRQAGFEQIEARPAGGFLSLLGSVPSTVCLGLLPERPAALVRSVLAVNRFASHLIVAIDNAVDRNKVFALNFVVVAVKPNRRAANSVPDSTRRRGVP